MTSYDYHMTMKNVRIADLKAHLSEHLRSVRRGETLTILDRDTPIARLVPIAAAGPMRVREPAPGGGGLQAVRLPPPLKLDVDIVDLLAEERRDR